MGIATLNPPYTTLSICPAGGVTACLPGGSILVRSVLAQDAAH